MSYSPVFFYITMLFYAISACLFMISAGRKKAGIFSYHRQWFLMAVISAVFFLLIRYKEGGHLPLVTLFEITFFYAWMISVFYLVFIKKKQVQFIKGLVLLIIYAILIWDIFLDKGMYPLNPLLANFWLGIHVPSAILSYSAFALSFAISVYYLVAEKRSWPTKDVAALNAWLVRSGFMLLSVCILTGSVWAKSAWGKYWSWDPKETWALITLIIYAGFIVARRFYRLSSRWQASLSIIGFITVLFTFFGVSLFLAGHHSYQQQDVQVIRQQTKNVGL